MKSISQKFICNLSKNYPQLINTRYLLRYSSNNLSKIFKIIGSFLFYNSVTTKKFLNQFTDLCLSANFGYFKSGEFISQHINILWWSFPLNVIHFGISIYSREVFMRCSRDYRKNNPNNVIGTNKFRIIIAFISTGKISLESGKLIIFLFFVAWR